MAYARILILKLKKSLLSFFIIIGISLSPAIGQSQTKEVQFQDTHRDIPGFVDYGLYQSYKITPEEINTMNSGRMHEMIEIYIRRYYDFYMYFSRNIIMKQVSEDYPAELLDPVVKKILSANDTELRKILFDFFQNEGGVTRQNKIIYDTLIPVLDHWDMKEFGNLRGVKGPPSHSPNAIYLAYLKKMGLRDFTYQPPFYSKGMDTGEIKKMTILDKITNKSTTENEVKGQIIAFIVGLIFGVLLLRFLSFKK